MQHYIIQLHEVVRVGQYMTAFLGPYPDLITAGKAADKIRETWAIQPKRITIHSVLNLD